jgi:hypothetical protein
VSHEIDLEIAESTSGKPKQLEPEDFGLSCERARILRDPLPASRIWENRWFWPGHGAVLLIGGVVAYQGTQSLAQTALIALFGFSFYLFGVAILVTVALAIFGSI